MSTPATLTRRQAFERRQRRRATVIAAVSTAVLLGALAALIPLTPGWDKVQRSFFDGDTFTSTFGDLFRAFLYDLQIFAWCVPCIVGVAAIVAVCRQVRSPALFPLRLLATVYTDMVRGVPVVLWIYLIGFGVPGLLQSREWGKPIIWGSVALIMSYSA